MLGKLRPRKAYCQWNYKDPEDSELVCFISRWETETWREREALRRERWFQSNGRLLVGINAPRNMQLCRLHVIHLYFHHFSLRYLLLMLCFLFDFFKVIESWRLVSDTFFSLFNIRKRFRVRSKKVFLWSLWPSDMRLVMKPYFHVVFDKLESGVEEELFYWFVERIVGANVFRVSGG